MKTRVSAFIVANLVPLLALAGAGVASMMVHSLLTDKEHGLDIAPGTPGLWVSLLVCALIGLFCFCIALWWLMSLGFYYSALLRSQRTFHQIQLPAWAPGLLKTLAGASIGIGALNPAAQAYALPSEQAAVLTAPMYGDEISSPLFPHESNVASPIDGPLIDLRSPATPLSPLFESPQTQTAVTILPVKGTSYRPISPLFGGSTPLSQISGEGGSNQEELSLLATPESVQFSGASEGKDAHPTENLTDTYTVASGDSLWSIAESRLAPDASGAEVLALVQSIYHLNQDTIPTLDTLIFPGQTIHLPR